jgi:dihydroneopterin aldolase
MSTEAEPVRISITGIEIWVRIGVPEKERAYPQSLRVDVEFEASLPERDDLACAVDYAAVWAVVRSAEQEPPRKLVETLVRDLAVRIREQFPVQRVKVRVHKFILPGTRIVTVEWLAP